ncbi:MAG: XTP/dITP diphosphatase [Pyrinomonadaceae bacterium]|nr:XTP/dITP diphosphatase [Pyrinomonadaceae bacterium]
MMKLVIATRNAGKIKELEELLADLPVHLHNLNDLPNTFEPEESGATFAENAALKAKSYALQTGLWALADDSGLEVEALNGAPGVFSARYAGENAVDKERIEKLLGELAETHGSNRRARFVCAVAVADESGEIKFNAEGICNGSIAFEASGEGGFGYDPIIIPDGFSATFGELANEIKQSISHRKQAIDKIIQQLRRFYDGLS